MGPRGPVGLRRRHGAGHRGSGGSPPATPVPGPVSTTGCSRPSSPTGSVEARRGRKIEPSLADFRAAAPIGGSSRCIDAFWSTARSAIGLYRNSPGPAGQLPAGVRRAGRVVAILLHRGAPAAVLTEVDGEASWSGRRPAGLPAGGDPLPAVRRPYGCSTPPATRPCRPSPRGWSATSATTPSAGWSDCRTAIRKISTSPIWPSCWPRTWSCWTTTDSCLVGRQRHRLRRLGRTRR